AACACCCLRACCAARSNVCSSRNDSAAGVSTASCVFMCARTCAGSSSRPCTPNTGAADAQAQAARVVVDHCMPHAFGGFLAALPARGFEQLARGPCIGVDLVIPEGLVVRVLNVLDGQVECEVWAIVLHVKLAPLQILLDQIDSELLPFTLAEHAVVVAAGVVLREVVGDRTGHAVIAHDAKRQQAIAVTVFMLCQIVPVELAISRARVALEDVHV